MSSIDNCSGSLTREQILQLSNEQKLTYFHANVVVQHPRMKDSLDKVLGLSTPNSGTDVILMIGPTGVGKSASIKTARKLMIKRYMQEIQTDPSFIPIVVVEAPATGEQHFSWRVLYERIGDEAHEPLLNKKALTVVDEERWRLQLGTKGSTVGGLRESIDRALKNRRTRLLVIDEAVHVLDACSREKLKSHMNALKSLTNLSGVTLCLTGSYDLFQLISLSGQVARRTAIVHFPRYLVGNAADESVFKRVVVTLQNRLPLERIPNLERWSLGLQKACVGCVGTLKDTLLRALTTTLENGGAWKDEYLRKAVLSEAAVAQILSETLKGESEVEKAIYGSRSLRDLMEAS